MTTYNFRLDSEQVDLIRAILVEFEDCSKCRARIEFSSSDIKDTKTLVREIRDAIQEARQTKETK